MSQFYGKKTGIKNILLLPLIMVVLGAAIIVIKIIRLSSDHPTFSQKIINNASADVPIVPVVDPGACQGTASCDSGGDGGDGGGCEGACEGCCGY